MNSLTHLITNLTTNVTKKATTAFTTIIVLSLLIALGSGNNLSLSAGPALPQYVSAEQTNQLSVVPFGNNANFSPNRTSAPAVAEAKLAGIDNGSDVAFLESGDGTAAGPVISSFSAAATALDDSFDRPDSSVVGSGWVEVEPTEASAVIAANKLHFSENSDLANRPLVRRGFSQVSTGSLEWDFDFDWARTGPEETYRFLMQLGDSSAMSDSSQNGGAGVNLIWTNINGAHQSFGYSKAGFDTALAVLSGPAHISVVADLGTQTYSVAVNASVVGTSIPFDANVPLNTVRLFTDNLNEVNFSGRTIDNLRVFSTDALPPVNAPPLAQDQSIGTAENTPRYVTLNATDPVECQLTVSIVTGPVNGSLGVLAHQPCVAGDPNSDSVTLDYTPDAGFTGSDSFTWQASDGQETSNEAIVSITVTPEAVTLLSDTFDRSDSLTVGPGWIEVEPAGASAVVAANKLHFAETSDGINVPLVKRSFPQVSTGSLEWDFDFDWAKTGHEGTYRFLMQLGDSAVVSNASQNGGAGVNLIWTSIDGADQSLGYSKAGTNTALAVVSVPAHISVVADLDAQTYSVALGGAVVGIGIPFDANGPLNLVRFFTDDVNAANFSGRTIDNLRVFSVPALNAPPVADGGPDQVVQVGATVDLNGSGSSDADGDALTYSWLLNTAPIGSTVSLTGSTTSIPSFVADLSGIYAVDLVVNDGADFSLPDTVTVTATESENEVNVAPVAQNRSVNTLQDVPIGLLLGFTDPDGTGPYIFSIVTPPISGILTGDGANRTYTPNPGHAGSDSFQWSVNDGQANSNVATTTVTTHDVNGAPLAQDDSVSTAKNVPIDQALIFTDPDGPGPYTFTIVSLPRSGGLTGDGANRTYTPNSWFTGSDSFQWSVNDGQANSNVATMTITINGDNVAPEAQDDAYAIFDDATLTVGLINGVLANDTDANGDILTAVLITDPPVGSGVLTFNEDGSFIFVPAVGFSGDVQFSYVADDGPVVSNTAVVTIDVAVAYGTLNLHPINAQSSVSVNPTLEIDCSVAATAAAHYQISTGSAFTTVVYDSGENINDICSHLAFAGLDTLTTYFWRGRIKDIQGPWTLWSQPTSFTTVDATSIFTNVFQDGLNGYDGAGDADIRGSAQDPTQVIRDWNQGAQDVLRTGRRLPGQPTDEIYRSLLQFDIDGGLTDPSAVINAYIELTGWHHTDSNHLFHAYNSMYDLNKPWSEGAGIKDANAKEGEVSWTYTDRPDQWEIPGAASASDTNPNADRSETALVQMLSTNQEGYKTYWSSQNLVDAVKGWISDPASNYGVLIKADDETSRQTLHRASRENPDITFRPKLVIVSTESLQSGPNEAAEAHDQSVNTGRNLSLGLQLAYTDPDGPSPYSFTIVTLPSYGTLTGSGANRTYTPNLGFIGFDSFTWQVNDGQVNSNVATVSIAVTETASLLSDTFDRPDSPVVGPGWSEGEQTGASAVIASNKLYFADTSDIAYRPLVSRSFSPVSTGTLQWDFVFDWARTNADGGYELWMQLGDSTQMINPFSSLTRFTGVGVDLRWGSFNNTDQNLVARQDTTKGGPTALAVISGPTQVSVNVDLIAKTYSVTIDGVEVGSGLSFDNLGTVSILDNVRFFTNNLDEQNFSGRTIDNLSVFYGQAGNAPPVAAAGPDLGIQVGGTVNLDGSGSTDFAGDPLSYSWLLTTAPIGSTAGLTGSTTSIPSFVTDLEGIYEVELVVNNGITDSAPDTVSITAWAGSIPLLSDTFDRDDSLEVGETWVELQSAGASVSIAANKLFFDHTSDALRRPLVSRSFSPVSAGTLQWDFDFDWARFGTDTNYELWMQLGDSTLMVNPTNSINRFEGVGVDLRWGNFSNIDQRLVARQNTTMGGPTALATLSGPAHVSVNVDLVTRTYSVAIDGAEVRSGLFFDDLLVEKLDTVRLFTDNLNETSFSGRTFDNVIISLE